MGPLRHEGMYRYISYHLLPKRVNKEGPPSEGINLQMTLELQVFMNDGTYLPLTDLSAHIYYKINSSFVVFYCREL